VVFSRLMIVQVKQKAQNALAQMANQKYVSMAVKKIRNKSSASMPPRPPSSPNAHPRNSNDYVVAPDLSTDTQVQQKLDKTEI
ncbi:hypothetical protein DYB28_015275, partial [Aphanomyces astaci]